MAETWFVYILCSSFFLGFYDFCKKRSVVGNRVMPSLFFATLSGSALFIACACVAGKLDSVLDCTGRQWLLMQLKTFLVAFSWVTGYFAFHDLPLTFVTLIRSSSPAWVVLGGVLLYGERPSGAEWTGIALIFGAYYFFAGIGKVEGFSLKSRGIRMAILAMLSGAASALYDNFLLHVEKIRPDVLQFHFSAGLVAVLGLCWLLQKKLPFLKEENAFRWRWTIPLTGLLLILADWCYFQAVACDGTRISVLGVMRRGSVVISFLCGAVFFGERHIVRKIIALAAVLAGIVIIKLG